MKVDKCKHIYLPIPSDFLTVFGVDAELNKCVLCDKKVTISETLRAYQNRQAATFLKVRKLLANDKTKNF